MTGHIYRTKSNFGEEPYDITEPTLEDTLTERFDVLFTCILLIIFHSNNETVETSVTPTPSMPSSTGADCNVTHSGHSYTGPPSAGADFNIRYWSSYLLLHVNTQWW